MPFQILRQVVPSNSNFFWKALKLVQLAVVSLSLQQSVQKGILHYEVVHVLLMGREDRLVFIMRVKNQKEKKRRWRSDIHKRHQNLSRTHQLYIPRGVHHNRCIIFKYISGKWRFVQKEFWINCMLEICLSIIEGKCRFVQKEFWIFFLGIGMF